MPNWCNNRATLTHTDPEMIQRVIDACEKGSLFQEFIPCPQDLLDTVSGYVCKEEVASHKLRLAYNLKNYGYQTWYEFKCAEWGTKWDVKPEIIYSAETSVDIIFESAWSPPIAAYEKLTALGFEITATYYEPGMNFCGEFVDGGDNAIDITENTVEWIRDNVPEHIDDTHGISESIEYLESEDDE